MHIVVSDSAAARLDAARQFVLAVPPASEVLIVSASRGAADDFAREVAPRPRRDVRPVSLQPDAAGRAARGAAAGARAAVADDGARRAGGGGAGLVRCGPRQGADVLRAGRARCPDFRARSRARWRSWRWRRSRRRRCAPLPESAPRSGGSVRACRRAVSVGVGGRSRGLPARRHARRRPTAATAHPRAAARSCCSTCR